MGNCLVLQGVQPKCRIKHMHYMLPQPESPRSIKTMAAKKKQTLRFSDRDGGVVRMKLVISKKELQEILNKREVSVGDVILKLQSQKTAKKAGCKDDGMTSKVRFPALARIPELD